MDDEENKKNVEILDTTVDIYLSSIELIDIFHSLEVGECGEVYCGISSRDRVLVF